MPGRRPAAQRRAADRDRVGRGPAGYERASEGLLAHRRTPPEPPPEPVQWPTDLGPDLYVIADLRAWLDGLRDDIARIAGRPEPGTSSAPTCPGSPTAAT